GARLIVGLPLAHGGVTLMQATPAKWRLLLEAGLPAETPFTALCGREGLPRNLANALLSRGASLWDLYGATETALAATALKIETGDDFVAVGRPIANTQIYLLDCDLQPVPIGVRGELYIGGVGLARGYLNQPELTAANFIPDPFGGEPGARLYKTGDLAR